MLADQFKPTKAQLSLLNRGLTFIPSIKIDKNVKTQLLLDVQKYHRRIKLATYFKDADDPDSTILPFMPPSDWTPQPHVLPSTVQKLVREDRKVIKKYFKYKKEKPNLSPGELIALKELKNNRQIVIKPADKGSSVVILGRDQYILEAEKQLKNDKYYKKLEQPIFPQTIPMIDKILNTLKAKKFINSKQLKYLQGKSPPRARKFYILPKIHKDPDTWTVPHKVPPGRPIVSDCDSESYHTAEYLDYFLNPLSTSHPSYVKDTYHFVELIKKMKLPMNSIFFTIDVQSLYTNIDTKSGLEAVKKMFAKYPDRTRPDKELLQLLEINLNRNDFEFNSEFYLQMKGTAMGKKFAPAYANIFMANWEEEALKKCPKKPLHYLRFLDDIWGIWIGTEEELTQFIGMLNAHDSSIKLTHTIDKNTINFLDTTIYKGPKFAHTGQLDIKVYFKKTDTHALLFKTSFHPKHTFRGLIKSQLIRFHRICTQNQDFYTATKTLFGVLRTRGYTKPFLKHCLRSFGKSLTTSKKNLKEKEIIPLVVYFSSITKALNLKFKENFVSIIENNKTLENFRVISAFKRNKNLQDLLVHATLPPIPYQYTKPHPTFFRRLTSVRNKTTKSIIPITQTIDPTTTNCVYLMECKKCGLQYVGETKNSITIRMRQHKYNITNSKETHTPVVKHFLLHGWVSVVASGLQHNPIWTDAERKKVERQWIYRLNTKEPLGLNERYYN